MRGHLWCRALRGNPPDSAKPPASHPGHMHATGTGPIQMVPSGPKGAFLGSGACRAGRGALQGASRLRGTQPYPRGPATPACGLNSRTTCPWEPGPSPAACDNDQCPCQSAEQALAGSLAFERTHGACGRAFHLSDVDSDICVARTRGNGCEIRDVSPSPLPKKFV